MIGIIALAVGVLVAGFILNRVGNVVEARVKGVTHTPARIQTAAAAAVKVGSATGGAVMHGYDRLPRLLAAFAASALAFVALAVIVSVACPPQNQFDVSNVDWNTRQGGYVGTAVDAVLVRTTGASIEHGLMYSTATLSGQTYVSVLGSPWLATDAPATIALFAYGALAIAGGAMGIVVSRALESRAKNAPVAAALSL